MFHGLGLHDAAIIRVRVRLEERHEAGGSPVGQAMNLANMGNSALNGLLQQSNQAQYGLNAYHSQQAHGQYLSGLANSYQPLPRSAINRLADFVDRLEARAEALEGDMDTEEWVRWSQDLDALVAELSG